MKGNLFLKTYNFYCAANVDLLKVVFLIPWGTGYTAMFNLFNIKIEFKDMQIF